MRSFTEKIRCAKCGKFVELDRVASGFIPDRELDGKPVNPGMIPRIETCPYCGSELEAGAAFCQSCGAKLEPEEQVKEPEEEPQNEAQPEEPEFKTEPIGQWDGQGTVRIAAIYNGIEVKAARKFSCTELIIDGKVYDTFDKIIEVQYTLAAEVNGVKYIYAQDGFGRAVLMADGNTLASTDVT